MWHEGSFTQAWDGFDEETRLRLAINELGRLHLSIEALRTDMLEKFAAAEKRQSRVTAFLLTILGGVIVGLVLLVVQLAGGQ